MGTKRLNGSSSGNKARTVISFEEIPPRIWAALVQLVEGQRYAADSGLDAWDFAVEIGSLGLRLNDLRWLFCMGLVEHAQEITRQGATVRSFRRGAGLTFGSRSCFVLTESGLLLVRQSLRKEDCGHDGYADAPTLKNVRRLSSSIPHWDPHRRELRLRDRLVKRFHQPALNQETILAAFQEEGWPSLIDDPLPPESDQEPKCRLHHTIRNLNRFQVNDLLRFFGNGTGTGVLWKPF